MATYVLALTELELACGVTLEDVARGSDTQALSGALTLVT